MLSYCKAILILTLSFLVPATAKADDKATANEVIAHHLDSIGTPAARSAAKSRVVEGKASYRVLVGGSGQIDGTAAIVSDGNKSLMRLKVTAQQYTGEWFTRDGDRTGVAGTYADKRRSEFGEFLRSQDLPIREGLLGGVLTTGWTLLDVDAHKGKLKVQGRKKIDGTDFQVVTYQPKKSTDFEITLYFEPETYRHVRTVYAVSIRAGLGQGSSDSVISTPLSGGDSEVSTARQQQTRYRIEERFSDFKVVDGLTLPSHYDLRFQEELQSGFTKLIEWDITTTRVMNNIPVDARNFQIH